MSNVLCQDCATPIPECSWMSHLEPVKGWTAQKKKCKVGGCTYHVTACPKFRPAPGVALPKQSVFKICPECGVEFEQKFRSGRSRKYCSSLCRGRAADRRRWERI